MKMAATFGWVEYLANATATATPTNLNFGSTLYASLNPTLYPVTAGQNGYEKWVKANFSGSFTNISNIQFWKSAGAYSTGEAINYTGMKTSFVAPTTTLSVIATTTLPVANPGTANVSIGGSLAGSLLTAGASDWIVMQVNTSTTTPAGATATKTFSLQYDEV